MFTRSEPVLTRRSTHLGDFQNCALFNCAWYGHLMIPSSVKGLRAIFTSEANFCFRTNDPLLSTIWNKSSNVAGSLQNSQGKKLRISCSGHTSIATDKWIERVDYGNFVLTCNWIALLFATWCFSNQVVHSSMPPAHTCAQKDLQDFHD